MEKSLVIYNTLTRLKEKFEPINSPNVGMYVCGPTVYGDAHVGHARSAINFDLLYRYLVHLGYKVRYIRNITDVGHLENDADEGEDKIGKKARVEQLEPMEIAQYFTNRYHSNMDQLNVKRPSIEPHASGHIPEQLEMIQTLIENGFAYESNGSVYFDVEAYNAKYNYGKLSGRKLEDLMANTRELDGQSEKRNPFDFALWKKASPYHIMQWNSAYSKGFPGWHLECSVMSTKYLGEKFDIHGGGLDLMFPHHECEIAQSVGTHGHESVKYWMHNNLITINGQKMGKSLGNFITLDELFSGSHALLEKAYNPRVVRFFILQAHYRNPLDFSNESLIAAEKALARISEALEQLKKINPSATTTALNVDDFVNNCYAALNDDLNTPILLSYVFETVKSINIAATGKEGISQTDIQKLSQFIDMLLNEILGIEMEQISESSGEVFNQVVDLLLNLRIDAKKNKDFATADRIRVELSNMGFTIKDTKDGFEWKRN